MLVPGLLAHKAVNSAIMPPPGLGSPSWALAGLDSTHVPPPVLDSSLLAPPKPDLGFAAPLGLNSVPVAPPRLNPRPETLTVLYSDLLSPSCGEFLPPVDLDAR